MIEYKMLAMKDFSRECPKKQDYTYQTLRACTSEKRISYNNIIANEFLRVGSYRYREQDLLGKGFSSKVYKAYHAINQQIFAIKVINLKKFKSSNLTMLENEIEIHRNLSHPNIVQFHDAYKTQNFYYIITEYCPNADLMAVLNQNKKITETAAIGVLEQIISGYQYLIKKSIIHRDLKPANIFKNGETWKIGDFGFAMLLEGESFYDKVNVGTPLYMPLESLKNNKYSFGSDIFALGIMLYEMVTGRTPWECRTQKQLISKMKSEAIKFTNIQNQNIKKFIQKACSCSESDRLTSKQLENFFNSQKSQVFINPEEKEQVPVKSLRTAMSLKNIRDQSIRASLKNRQKTSVAIGTIRSIKKCTSGVYESSTEVSEQSDSQIAFQAKKIKNSKFLVQELQFCRLIYYMTRNINHFDIGEKSNKQFLNLVLFKYLLRSIKQLEEPQKNFSNHLVSFEQYQTQKQYLKLSEEIRNYSKRYEKQYLDVLKNTQISVIRNVNRKFPELSYNSTGGDQFYENFCAFLFDTLRLLNHNISINSLKQKQQCGSYQSIESFLSFCETIKQKTEQKDKKSSDVHKYATKVVMDYGTSKINKKDFQKIRQRIKKLNGY